MFIIAPDDFGVNIEAASPVLPQPHQIQYNINQPANQHPNGNHAALKVSVPRILPLCGSHKGSKCKSRTCQPKGRNQPGSNHPGSEKGRQQKSTDCKGSLCHGNQQGKPIIRC